ncbi:uncharacterized protein HMPREF1541_04534 [Cyphellophora europaea CBS 101466]|uniref:AB hydrolase-1 domain-containing protein n=1 Tax=Cyphellophora europaea (strain CBS 101466) TaxID=1220924 RepID=W2RWU2_CYPE1|nr:uncharacterized protein HMPREF1541_04534 [Cyphellophora europaea CBS 101466]ETN40258.1 hypothetical protein HMPREF1541_04534 [Cyphellophora europaea CBS 101466]
MASNPVILFVPGSFAPAKLYTTVVETIKSAGYEVEIYDLPSASRTPPQKSADMYEDAALFRGKALDIIQSGKTVLLIAHSYGGLVASEAIKGLHTDAKTGPAVVGFVALAALLIPVGVSLKAGMSEPPAYLKIEASTPYEHRASSKPSAN